MAPCRFKESRYGNERGVALIMAMLILLLMSALMVGFTTAVMGDQRSRFVDRDRTRAFYAAQSGLERLNTDLANLFFVKVAPTPTEIGDLSHNPPVIPDVSFTATGATYGVTTVGAATAGQITTGPYQGLIALKQTYDLDAGVHTSSGGEAHLKRKVETVAIPVFQFGIFSDVDLSFSAADEFDFGGRVHTNGSLFLAQGGGSTSTLWLRDRVTAVKEVIRQRLSNGVSIDTSGSTRLVKVATAPGSFRTLARTEGSLTDGIGSAANPSWSTLSLSSYNGYLRTGKTGAKALNLPLITTGGANSDLVRRAAANENVANPTLLGERYFSKTSLRILLSDKATDITSLPGVTAAAPVSLDGNWWTTPPNNGTAYGPVNAAHPPIARSPGPVTSTVNAAVAAPAAGATINIPVTGALPAYFQLPATAGSVRVRNNAGVAVNVVCTGKTANSLTGCAPTPNPAVSTPATLEADLVTTDGAMTTTVPLSAKWNVGSTTISLGAAGTFTTANLAANTFWVQNANGTNVLVTCTGYDTAPNPDVFTGCSFSTALQANAVITTAALHNAGLGTIGGFIKIELQDTTGTWRDVTMEILNWGIAAPNVEGKACPDPTPNAIVRLERLRDNAEIGAYACTYPLTNPATARPVSTDYWPNVLFDAREAIYRETVPGTALKVGGVMHYITIDVANLSKWFAGTAPYAAGSGNAGIVNNGYSVYFSDRRNNRNAASAETGEYGFEDFVNPASGTATPNNVLDPGEDVNGNGTLETYGQMPNYNGVYNALPPGAAAPYDANVRPWTDIRASQARVNRPVLFRRALKLINGSLGNIVAPGLTIASENPVYVQGDWNATQAGFGNPHVATSVVADGVTLLSNAWNDSNSLKSPYSTAGRPRDGNTYYRLAIIAGKGPIFPNPAGTGATYGTDGGAHSFLRFLEGSGGADTIHYRGSLATFYFNRQTVSPFKCCAGIVYDVPVRDFVFDIDFLDPAKLPPLTPVFRDLNALGFTQEIRPGH